MKTQISKYLFIFAVGFLTCFTIVSPKKETKILKGEDITITVIDTVYVDKPYPKIITKEKKVLVPYETVLLDTVYLVNSKNFYRDTLEMEKDYSIAYNATTTGTLDKISLTSIDNRKDKIVKETTTIVKQPVGLYIGATTNLKFQTSVGALLIKDRNIMGVSVNLNQDSFSNPTKYNVSYYRKLF